MGTIVLLMVTWGNEIHRTPHCRWEPLNLLTLFLRSCHVLEVSKRQPLKCAFLIANPDQRRLAGPMFARSDIPTAGRAR